MERSRIFYTGNPDTERRIRESRFPGVTRLAADIAAGNYANPSRIVEEPRAFESWEEPIALYNDFNELNYPTDGNQKD